MMKEIYANNFIRLLAENNVNKLRQQYELLLGDSKHIPDNLLHVKLAQHISDMGVHKKNGNSRTKI